VPDIGSNIISNSSVRAYFGLLVIVFILFSWLRLRGFINLDKYRYDIVSIGQLTPIDYKLRLKPASGAIRPPKRGQYIYLKLGIVSEDHPFSVVGYDETTGEISIAYRLSGSFTKELSKLTVGQDIWVGGPYGSFMSDLSTDSNQPSVYISGGIGITPFVERIARENGVREQWLFACNRTREVSVFVDWLREIASNRVVSVLSNDPSSSAEQGYFRAEILQRYLTDPQRYHYYFCGPPAMKEPVYAELAKLGIPENQIESEKFGW
jgi:predicted ferric reductase